MKNRKRAPGRPEEHPDVVFSLSGGVDCVAAMLTALEAFETVQADGNMAKKPFGLYLDTRTGTPLNRLYVEQLCDWAGIQLACWRTDEQFEQHLADDDAPGPGRHQRVRNELKDRQASRLVTLSGDIIMILGIAADESETRAGFDKVREMKRHIEIYPVHRLSRKERVEIIIRSCCPINPLWLEPKAIRDCGCLCNGDPSELDKTEELFPHFAQRLREWEEAINHDGIKDTLGWGGLTATDKDLEKNDHQQATITTCDIQGGCPTARDPAEVRAFQAIANGETVERAVEILYSDDDDSEQTRGKQTELTEL
jgi:3'-phosphoadenosine 5'-phosphosulfate sulfotransferase (PAPS reductase)/FAD synthetase